jgi:hypothetical protein
MEFSGRHTSCLSSQHENSSWAANKEGPSDDMELEVVTEECTNGGAAEEARENMLLLDDDNLWFLQRQKDINGRQVFYSCVVDPVGSITSTLLLVVYYLLTCLYILATASTGALHDCCFRIVIRFGRVGVKPPAIEVRYEKLCVEAESRYSSGATHLPTLWNSIKAAYSVRQ